MSKKITAPDILAAKGQRKLAVLTAADYPTGVLADKAGVDMILVGDSLGMVTLGMKDTLSVTMEHMLHHCAAVSRGVERALVIGDMPFMSYQSGTERAVANAGRFLQEAGAMAVKLEGGRAFAPQVKAIAQAGIPVMGHLGLTPQFIASLGGFKLQAKTADAVRILLEDAQALIEAGIFALVLEAMPTEAAKAVTEAISVPTIGIGAGPGTDGQVLVTADLLGMFDRFTPKFAKRYAELGQATLDAMGAFIQDVASGAFPAEEHSTRMDKDELAEMKKNGL